MFYAGYFINGAYRMTTTVSRPQQDLQPPHMVTFLATKFDQASGTKQWYKNAEGKKKLIIPLAGCIILHQ
jgi:hypothetical protein